jgi:DNA processing protein
MTSLLASPDTPNPDLTATVTLPTQDRHAPAEPVPTPQAQPTTAESRSAISAAALAGSTALIHQTSTSGSHSPTSAGAPPSATPPPPSLLAPTSLFYAARADSASSTAPEPKAPAPNSEPAPAPPPPSLLAPTSIYYTSRADSAPSKTSPAPEPSPPPSPPASDPLASPPPHPSALRRVPEPLLVTSAPHDPTAADRRARLVLHHASEPGDALLCRLVTRFGAPTVASAILAGSAADLLSPRDEESAGDLAALVARAHTLQTRCYRADPDADLETGEKSGARYVIPADPEWPTALADLGDSAPLGLWFLGSADLVAASKRGVSIVGARIATGYGLHVAGELAAGLAERGWAVVSGAARGIDGAAHRGALAARGVTVAALACGIDLVYPRGHEALIGAIASEGLVVSELPPGTSVSRFRFLDRNRVIAALGLGTVVVEAAARSGSLVTARLADGLGRPILAVPGPITSEASEGTHQLIRDGALLVTSAAEVIEQLGDLGADLADPAGTTRTRTRRPRDSLGVIEARVLDALPIAGRGTLDTVEAALAAGLEPRTVHAALVRLSSAGWVDRDERGWCARLLP